MNWKRTLSYVLAISGGFACIASATKCPLSEVPQYVYDCGIQALIRKPANLAKYKQITTDADCAKLCLDNKACDTLRWVNATSECYLYSKYLKQMFVDYTDYGPGTIWERECWTSDCNIIASCAASKKCKDLSDPYPPYNYAFYNQYACSYGKTAKSTNAAGQQLQVYGTNLYNGSLSICQVASMCASQEYEGSLDIHYYIPSNQWVCVIYNDVTNFHDPAPSQEDISRTRYSVKNESVGAGYGYKWDFSYDYIP